MTRAKFQKTYQSFRTTDRDVAEIHKAYVNENAKGFQVQIIKVDDQYALIMNEPSIPFEAVDVLDI